MMEAIDMLEQGMAQMYHWWRLTLQELLAGIFLEEGLVGDGPCQVVDHQEEDRLDLLLGVAGIVLNGFILGQS